jgi:hypothetical protein
MKYIYSSLLLIFALSFSLRAQSTKDYAVMVSAKVQSSPPKITLGWPLNPFSHGITIYRKAQSDQYWGSPIAKLAGTDTVYEDTNDSIGHSYEYKIQSDDSSFQAYGYILAGIEAPAIEYRGKMILLVDDSLALPLAKEIDGLILDMQGDGWIIIRHNIKRKAGVVSIKDVITGDYYKDKKNTKALFLLGHIPVPYSGDFAPDGHSNHYGAWPADSYYGDMTGFWQDYYYNDKKGDYKRNWNTPGDGKFDNDKIPAPIDLEVGRVDLHDMPAFIVNEEALMRRYLNKDHAFRTKRIVAKEQALVDDNFGTFGGEAFASSGYKAFAPMFGASHIKDGKYLEENAKDSYLWSYACGGGEPLGFISYFHTDSLVKDSLHTVFNMMFGSWFGDWEFQDDFLRAPLASKGWTLTNCWSGRPQFIMHQMALGENIGYCARISAQDTITYYRHPAQVYGCLRNNALMGDPSLRMHILAPPGKVGLTNNSDSAAGHTYIKLNWMASPDAGKGYNIYRATAMNKQFIKVNSLPVIDTAYIDSSAPRGSNVYMVRTLNLQKSGSGTYYNMSEGIFSSSTYSFHVGINEPVAFSNSMYIFPNPASGSLSIELEKPAEEGTIITANDILGKEFLKVNISGLDKLSLNIEILPQGVYFLTIKNKALCQIQKFIKN